MRLANIALANIALLATAAFGAPVSHEQNVLSGNGTLALQNILGAIAQDALSMMSGADPEAVVAQITNALHAEIAKAGSVAGVRAQEVSAAQEMDYSAFNAFAAAHTTMEPYMAPQLTEKGTPYNTPLVPDVIYNLLGISGLKKKAIQPLVNKYVNLWSFNWFTHKEQPAFLTPVAKALVKPLQKRGFEKINVLDASDEFWISMLTPNPDCPDRLKGFYWMQDNIVSEVIVSLCDGDWSETPAGTSAYGVKPYQQQWSRDSETVFGAGLTTAAMFLEMTFPMSENKKWIAMDAATLIYIPDDDEVLMTPETGRGRSTTPAAPVPFDSTMDMLRVSLNEGFTLNSPDDMWYNYRLRRVMYLDDEGKLVKTAAWDEMAALMAEPLPNPSEGAGDYLFMGWDAKLENQLKLSPEQLIKPKSAMAK